MIPDAVQQIREHRTYYDCVPTRLRVQVDDMDEPVDGVIDAVDYTASVDSITIRIVDTGRGRYRLVSHPANDFVEFSRVNVGGKGMGATTTIGYPKGGDVIINPEDDT